MQNHIFFEREYPKNTWSFLTFLLCDLYTGKIIIIISNTFVENNLTTFLLLQNCWQIFMTVEPLKLVGAEDKMLSWNDGLLSLMWMLVIFEWQKNQKPDWWMQEFMIKKLLIHVIFACWRDCLFLFSWSHPGSNQPSVQLKNPILSLISSLHHSLGKHKNRSRIYKEYFLISIFFNFLISVIFSTGTSWFEVPQDTSRFVFVGCTTSEDVFQMSRYSWEPCPFSASVWSSLEELCRSTP